LQDFDTHFGIILHKAHHAEGLVNPKVRHFLPFLATFYEQKITFSKKLAEQAPGTYFHFDVF
jgi:hypothetical protein